MAFVVKKSFNETKNEKHDTRNDEKINKKDSKVDSSVVFIFPQNKFGIFQQLRSFFVPLPFSVTFFSLSRKFQYYLGAVEASKVS